MKSKVNYTNLQIQSVQYINYVFSLHSAATVVVFPCHASFIQMAFYGVRSLNYANFVCVSMLYSIRRKKTPMFVRNKLGEKKMKIANKYSASGCCCTLAVIQTRSHHFCSVLLHFYLIQFSLCVLKREKKVYKYATVE